MDNEIFVEICYYVTTAIATIIGTVKSNEMMKSAVEFKRFIKKKKATNNFYKKLLRPTFYFWSFIFFIAASVALTKYKDYLNKEDDKKWQTKVDEMNKEVAGLNNKVARMNRRDSTQNVEFNNKDSLRNADYTSKVENFNISIIRSDTLHTNLMNNYTMQLNQWGLSIRDTMIVRDDRKVLIILGGDLVTYDSTSIKPTINFTVCNKGSDFIESVECRFFLINTKDVSHTNQIGFSRISFGPSDCYDAPMDVPKEFFNLANSYNWGCKFTYTYKGIVYNKYYTVGYEESKKLWGFGIARYNKIMDEATEP